jgi:aminoglycoside phosphotransferase (APT) family kinase protein
LDVTDTSHVAIEAASRILDAVSGVPEKLAGGAMHDSWAVAGMVGGMARELVVRVSPAGRADHEKTRREFEVLRVAFARGVRCPEPIGIGQLESGEDYLVMARVAGDTNPRQLVAGPGFTNTRAAMIPQLAEDLAFIHRIAPGDVADAPGMVAPAPGEDPLAAQRRTVEETYRQDLLNPHPAIEWAFRWMDRRIAAITEPGRAACVIHGDFRVGNLLYDERGLTSVLDWEGTHVSEPEEDLAWFCTRVWRFGREDLEAGGIAPREEWIRAYERASGRRIDRERVAAWEVLQNIRWCQITMMQARAHLDGKTRSHELAAIGRRTAETELEILRLTGALGRVRHAG